MSRRRASRVAMLLAAISAGGLGAAELPVATQFGEVDVSTPFLQARRVTIYGGSSEIQRNVLARRVLNLPN